MKDLDTEAANQLAEFGKRCACLYSLACFGDNGTLATSNHQAQWLVPRTNCFDMEST